MTRSLAELEVQRCVTIKEVARTLGRYVDSGAPISSGVVIALMSRAWPTGMGWIKTRLFRRALKRCRAICQEGVVDQRARGQTPNADQYLRVRSWIDEEMRMRGW